MSSPAPTNLRDLRGLRTDDGRIVRRGVLYRSEVPLPGGGAGSDVAIWPPAVVVDLRTAEEHSSQPPRASSVGPPDLGTGPHPLDAPGTAVHRVPMGADLAPALADRSGHHDLGTAYRMLVRDAAARIAVIVGLVAGSPGPVLVHCTAGKDRTGIVVAVLLRAVGVRRSDVVADYLRTEANLPRLWAALQGAGIRAPRNRALMGVHVGALEAVLDELDAVDGGAAGWLATHGVGADTLARLSDRLLSPVRAPAA
ncbi:tyrosine-protein phosphatase [Pseudonocardia sp.]|uniref:tyrosine-protein phosphatase n=1 Tax=Pseudonocardia sp. TaxID=60912 RepID=UPI0026341DAA|nr:tyrosine-protein phosphatase [Pseudonocardia sp.]